MVTLEMLRSFENDMNEIKEKCLEILKWEAEQDKKRSLVKISRNISKATLNSISDFYIEKDVIFFNVGNSYYDPIYGEYEINFSELSDRDWKENFLKRLSKLENENKLKKELEIQNEIEQQLLRDKEEYKRLREKFEKDMVLKND